MGLDGDLFDDPFDGDDDLFDFEMDLDPEIWSSLVTEPPGLELEEGIQPFPTNLSLTGRDDLEIRKFLDNLQRPQVYTSAWTPKHPEINEQAFSAIR